MAVLISIEMKLLESVESFI